MGLILRLLGALGALITLAACVQLIRALRAGQPREVIVGWFVIMLVPALFVFALVLALAH